MKQNNNLTSRIDITPKVIKVACPAKINLTLEILNKRPDGFHDIQSVMQTINLFDFLTIKLVESQKLEINLSGTSNEIPYDERNLVHKAVMLFFDRLDQLQLVREGVSKTDEWLKKIINQRAKVLRKDSTLPEKILWHYLRDRRFDGLKFRRQVPIKKYIADFACFEKKLIIELDGSGHLQDKTIKYDKKREEFLTTEGFTVLRYYNTDIFNQIESVLEEIYRHTSKTPHPNPLPQGAREETEINMNAEEGKKSNTLLPSVGEGVCRTDEGANQNYTISIHIEKNIPISAGLAGGSTDAAGTIWGLNKLFNNILSNTDLHALCAKLGSDLNFCLEGGCQLTTGRGEILEKLPFCEFELSLIKPKNLGISAKEAYTKFSALENKPNLNITTKLVAALNEGNCNVENFLHNDLEVAVFKDYAELQQIKKAYPTSIMSGSGSTYFILGRPEMSAESKDFWVKTNLSAINYGVAEAI